MNKTLKRILAMLLLLTMLIGIFPTVVLANNTSGGYDWQGKWIWTSDSPSEGQWIDLRKTFTLKELPEKAEARISVDSRYWMWINGEMVVYEGQLKGGPDTSSWYYDVVDLAPYLREGKNTIAILAVYWGFSSASSTPTGNQGLLFDAQFSAGALSGGGTRLVSDNTWKVQKDPAYEKPPARGNKRPDSPDVKYNASKAIEGWQEISFDDSKWSTATVKKLSSTDPRNNLVERAIPMWKVSDIVKYSTDDMEISRVTDFASLSLPESYTVTYELRALNGNIGLALCVGDANNYYMPQIIQQGGKLTVKPHVRKGGKLSELTLQDKATVSGSLSGKMTVTAEVTPTEIVMYINGTKVGSFSDTQLERQGSGIGFRASTSEEIAIYSMKITSLSGDTIWEDDISESTAGADIQLFGKLSGNDPVLEKDTNGVYLKVNNGVTIAGQQVQDENSDVIYSFYNRSNIQGAPYLKVRSANGGEIIHITSDATMHSGGEAVTHWYVTRAGEQEWEALSWTNAYRVDVTVPASVEVIELGFRESSYNTEHTGNVTTSDPLMNQLYQEAYDTLLVTMRDIYMDSPDRERTQWWGDAVLEMQQAAYAMDEDARYLYKKLLTQVVGWSEDRNGSLSTVPTNPSYKELPAQCLAGVHSLWQYYLYYGETDILDYCYQSFIDYLNLWDVSDTGYVSHRSGTSDWVDWGVKIDASVSEHCWYYLAAQNMKNVAELLNKPQTDIDFLENRISLIMDNFDTMFWNERLGAYYSSVSNGRPDDRAQAMAVYSGLADPVRYPQILEIFKTTENSSPYMEKYVLEAMYIMGYAEEAISRMLKRYNVMLTDDHPTLYEEFDTSKLSVNGVGTATRNHAWSGGPLSIMYMYAAGITSTDGGFKSFRVSPQLGSLTDLSATTDTMYGKIYVNVTKTSLSVTVPTGTSAEICIPRLDGATVISLGGTVIYDNGSPTSAIPNGIYYTGEDTDFVRFKVGAGSYSFTMTEDAPESGNSHVLTVRASNGGTVTVNGTVVNGTYTYTGTGSVNVTITPDAGNRIAFVAGSYNEEIYSTSKKSISMTLDGDATLNVLFDQPFDTKHNIRVIDQSNDCGDDSKLSGMFYAFRLFINGEEVYMRRYIGESGIPALSLPYMTTAENGEKVTVKVIPVDERNYSVDLWMGAQKLSNEIELEVTSDLELSVTVTEKSNVEKLKIESITADDSISSSSVWSLDYLYDGIRISVWDKANGYSSTGYSTNTPSKPITMTMDLGSIKPFNQVSLFPRNSFESITGGARCFPVDFTISISTDGINFATVVTVKDATDPYMHQQTYNFDDIEARYVRLTVTKLGAPELGVSAATSYRLQLSEIEIARVLPEPVVNIPDDPDTGDIPSVDSETSSSDEDIRSPEETELATQKKGCGSSVSYGMWIVLMSIAVTCPALMKKNKRYKKEQDQV